MKKYTFFKKAAITAATVCIAFAMQAQQIAVVSPSGTTTTYIDINLALCEAPSGSIVYLSGGGFVVNDSVKIKKKLTVTGIGHRPDNDNADGFTSIVGNLFFEENSDGSALIGVWMSGDVYIATIGTHINNFLLRFCNINSFQVRNGNCLGIFINQNYLRGTSNGGNSPITLNNNILSHIQSVTGGIIEHNFIHSGIGHYNYPIYNSQIKNNICLFTNNYVSWSVHNCIIESNMGYFELGGANSNSIVVSDWNEVLEGPWSGINVHNNYALKPGAPGTNAATNGSDIGIYGGTGFSNTALPPGPRIVSKRVANQTDVNGKLRIEIEVSAE